MAAEQNTDRDDADKSPRTLCVYLSHFIGYFPKYTVKVFNVYQNKPSNIDHWTDSDYKILIDEGRIQVERQQRDLEQIRARAQFMLTTGLVLLAGLLAVQDRLADHVCAQVFWWLGFSAAVIGVLGLGAVSVSTKTMNMIDAAELTACEPPVEKELAEAYGRMMGLAENTLATELTMFRLDVLAILVGLLLAGLALVIAR